MQLMVHKLQWFLALHYLDVTLDAVFHINPLKHDTFTTFQNFYPNLREAAILCAFGLQFLQNFTLS
jgi:hypothetical protein